MLQCHNYKSASIYFTDPKGCSSLLIQYLLLFVTLVVICIQVVRLVLMILLRHIKYMKKEDHQHTALLHSDRKSKGL